MNSRHVGVLLRIEMRRHLPHIRKTAVTLAGAVVLGLFLHSRTFLQFAILSVGVSLAVPGPAETARERISGDLLHLVLLPVDASSVAAAKLGGCAFLSALGALVFAAAGALWLPGPLPSLSPVEAGGLAFSLAWTGSTLLSCLTTALLLRMGMGFLLSSYLPIGTFGVLAGFLWVFDRLLPHPWGSIQNLLGRPWLPWASAAAAAFFTLGTLWVCFRLAASGIRGYRPRPDRLAG